MSLSDEVRKLERKWTSGSAWPKWLEWMEPDGIRGWVGQRVPFNFPIVAIVGENGSGKSTLLQAAACAYRSSAPTNSAVAAPRTYFPSEFFPDTHWDQVTNASIKYGYKQGTQHAEHSVRKPTSRWLGQPERPDRRVEYIDLSRLQPVATRVGYARIAKNKHIEASATAFNQDDVGRLSTIMGRQYVNARMAVSDIDQNREIPVLSKATTTYSGFHQGSGETTVAELLRANLPKYGLVLIDEIESSLHPRAQRRLLRDLATLARVNELQIVITTHSPYVLEELPLEARIYILETDTTKSIVSGVSPQFAMTKMDDEAYPECELYVEDTTAKIFLSEILMRHAREVFLRCTAIPYGASNLGIALGEMASKGRFPRPTCVFLDGDIDKNVGCTLLPGSDAPERVVFNGLRPHKYGDLWVRIGRDVSVVIDACERATLLKDHHDWVQFAANQLMVGGDTLWQAMCAEWAAKTKVADLQYLIDAVENVLP